MANGVIGQSGVNVLRRVGMLQKYEQDSATTQHHNMVAVTAWEVLRKSAFVFSYHVKHQSVSKIHILKRK